MNKLRKTNDFFQRLMVLLALMILGCGDDPETKSTGSKADNTRSEKTTRRDDGTKNSLGTKIALIVPAGGGAARVSLHIAAALEQDLGLLKLGDIIDGAGGISSGAIAASALSHGVPIVYSARELEDKTKNLVSSIFPATNELLASLKSEYKLSLYELNAIFLALQHELSKSSVPDVTKAFIGAIQQAESEVPGLEQKLGGLMGLFALGLKYQPYIAKIRTLDGGSALKDFLLTLYKESDLGDEANNKLIVMAAHKDKPVFFAGQALSEALKAPYAIPKTLLSTALLSSSAVPGLYALQKAQFKMPDGGEKELGDLKDGAFAGTSIKFDPSALLSKVYEEKFLSEDLVIVYFGNGSPIDQSFRKTLKNFKDGISEQVVDQRKLTYIAIDAQILDDKGHDLFAITQFDGSKEAIALLDRAANKAIKSLAYDNALKVLKALQGPGA